ncbi:MAG: 5-formyltetrahydrofolate cyclo-ligase [Bdellovibrionota bacterium]
MISKQQLRQAFRTNLERDTDISAYQARSRDLCSRLLGFLSVRPGLWAGFMPVGFEPDISPIYSKTENIQWAFPRVDGETLSFFVPSGPLVMNQWNIPEPDPERSRHVELGELRGLLVPGLAFDLQCNRLGRGRGYYDRALGSAERNKNTNSRARVGIAFERQIASTSLPTDSHDQAMDWVITESREIKRNQT